MEGVGAMDALEVLPGEGEGDAVSEGHLVVQAEVDGLVGFEEETLVGFDLIDAFEEFFVEVLVVKELGESGDEGGRGE